jgi:hypothetical protein
MCKQNKNDDFLTATAASQENGGMQQPTATATKRLPQKMALRCLRLMKTQQHL